MNFRHKNIIRREWKYLFRDINSVLFISLLPLAIVLQAFFVAFIVVKTGDQKILSDPFIMRSIDNIIALFPAASALSGREQFVLLFVSLLPVYFNIIPAMIAVSLSTFSVVEEKMSGTMEPLLATPVRTDEIILGKAVAHLIPSLLSTYFSFLLFLLLVYLFNWLHIVAVIPLYYWIIVLLVFVPLSAALCFLMGIAASSWAKNPKSAQNIAMIFVLPLLGLTGAQFAGFFSITPYNMAGIGIVLAGAVFLALRISVRIFDREHILIKWKS